MKTVVYACMVRGIFNLIIFGSFVLLAACGSKGGKSQAADPGFTGIYVLNKAYVEFDGADQQTFCSTVNSHPTLHGVNPTDNHVKSKPDVLQILADGKVMRYSIDPADNGAKNPDGQIDRQGNFKLDSLYVNQYPIGQARTNHLEDGGFSFANDSVKYLKFFNTRSHGTRTYRPIDKKSAEAYLSAVAFCASKITPIDYGVE